MNAEAWTRLPWQDGIWSKLKPSQAHSHHAYLLNGPEGIGKQRLGRALAAAWLCISPKEDEAACGECESCQWLQAGNHPDFRWLTTPARLQEQGAEEDNATPDAEDANSEKRASDQIGIDAVRSLASFFSLTTHRGGVRILLIEPAEALNTAAANALLKTLEEPPAGTRFILVSSQARRLPATVLSRCLNVSIPLPSLSDAKDWLRVQGVEAIESVLSQAAGRPLRALALSDPEKQLARQDFIKLLARLEHDPYSLTEKVNRDNVALWTEWLQSWCYDLLACSQNVPIRFNPEHQARIQLLSQRLDIGKLLDWERKLRIARYQSRQPVNPRLFSDDLLVDYCAILQ